MPVIDGHFVPLDEWHAIQAAERARAEGANRHPEPHVPEHHSEPAKPKRGSNRAKKDAAAQVMAALGIDPGTAVTTATVEPTQAVEPAAEPDPTQEPVVEAEPETAPEPEPIVPDAGEDDE